MNKNINIALVGLGQIGIYLYDQIQKKRKDIEIKTEKNKYCRNFCKNINKKRRFK